MRESSKNEHPNLIIPIHEPSSSMLSSLVNSIRKCFLFPFQKDAKEPDGELNEILQPTIYNTEAPMRPNNPEEKLKPKQQHLPKKIRYTPIILSINDQKPPEKQSPSGKKRKIPEISLKQTEMESEPDVEVILPATKKIAIKKASTEENQSDIEAKKRLLSRYQDPTPERYESVMDLMKAEMNKMEATINSTLNKRIKQYMNYQKEDVLKYTYNKGIKIKKQDFEIQTEPPVSSPKMCVTLPPSIKLQSSSVNIESSAKENDKIIGDPVNKGLLVTNEKNNFEESKKKIFPDQPKRTLEQALASTATSQEKKNTILLFPSSQPTESKEEQSKSLTGTQQLKFSSLFGSIQQKTEPLKGLFGPLNSTFAIRNSIFGDDPKSMLHLLEIFRSI